MLCRRMRRGPASNLTGLDQIVIESVCVLRGSHQMNDREQVVARIFKAALGLSTEERSAYLDSACAGDVDLRRRVERLLSFDATDNTMLDAARGDLLDDTSISSQ